MAYSFEQVFAADPSNPSNVAQNASITIFAPGDGTMTPIAITDPDGQPLANPIPVNANGFGSAFMADIDRVAWLGGGFTGFFTSYEGMKEVAVASQAAAEAAASSASAAGETAAAEAAAALSGAVTDAENAANSAATSAAAATDAAALVGAPADTAISAAIEGSNSATHGTLHSTFDRVWGVRPTDTTAQIIAKAQAAKAAGGGTVKFPAGTWTLTESLPILAGVEYRGVKPRVEANNVTNLQYMPDSQVHFAGGTVLTGPTTFPAFSGNDVPQGSIATDIGNTQIANAGIIGFGTDGFTKGISAGATNIMGMVWGKIDEFYAINYSEWGVDMANFQHMDFGVIRTFERDAGTPGGGGQRYEARLPYLTLIPGNSNALELFHRTTNQAHHSRGIVIGGDPAVATSQLGGVDVAKLQVNAYNKVLTSQTASFTNASTAVTVTDGTKFRAGMAVNFTATGNGYTANKIYIVLSVAGNVLTLATSKQTAAISATATGTLTIQTYGFPNAEFTNFGSSTIHDLDLEGTCSVALYTEVAKQVSYSIRTIPTTTLADIVGRGSTQGHYHVSPLGAKTDFDSTSTSGSQYFGGRATTYGRPLMGLYWDAAAGSNALQIGNGDENQTGGDIHVRRNGFLYPGGHGIGEKMYVRNSATTLSGANVGNVIVTTNTSITLTLPEITTEAGTAQSTSIVGGYYNICNTGLGTVTVPTTNSQTFNNKAGITSLNVAPGATLKVIGTQDGATFFWLAIPGTLA